MIAGYKCSAKEAPLDLFVSTHESALTQSRTLGRDWIHLGLLRVHEVPGGHFTKMIEPTVSFLATVSWRSIQEADVRHRIAVEGPGDGHLAGP